MARVSVGKVADIPQGKLIGAEIEGEKILVANVDGSLYAMRSTCNHAGGPLHQGKLEGKIVTCPSGTSPTTTVSMTCGCGALMSMTLTVSTLPSLEPELPLSAVRAMRPPGATCTL